MLRLLTALFLFFCFTRAWAQEPATTAPAQQAATKPAAVPKMPTDPEKFGEYATALMASTRNPAATEVGIQFGNAFSGGRFTSAQKARVLKITKGLIEKKGKTRPHLENLFNTLAQAVNNNAMSGKSLDMLLLTIDKTVERDELTRIENLLKTSALFLENKTLYAGKLNRLRVPAAAFSFDYVDGGGQSLIAEAPKPEPVKEAPKPEPVTKPAAKSGAKSGSKAAAKKPAKKADDGWGNTSNDGWGNAADDGWGTPAKTAKPAKKADDGWGNTTDDGWGTPAKTSKPAKKADDGWGSAADDGWGTPATPAKDTKAKKADDAWGDDSGWSSGSAADEASTVPDEGLQQKIAFMAEPLPIISGPVLTFSNVDMAIATAYDSALIEKTSGTVLLGQQLFVGKGGTFRWSTAGFPESDVYCELKDFAFNVTKPEFKAEKVIIHHPSVLEASVEGVLNYRSAKRNSKGQPNFPRFLSLTNDAKVKNLGDNIKYKGGFSLNGLHIASGSVDESPSVITVSAGGVPKFRSTSTNYQLADSLIRSKRASVTIFQGADSIYHPAMQLKYAKDKRILTLVKDEGAFKYTPFFDSYHQMELRTEIVKWELDSSKVNFGILNAKDQVPMNVESLEYFEGRRYYQMKGTLSFHPLQLAVGYAQAKKVNKFYALDLAEYAKLKLPDVKAAMAWLARDGFIDYNGQAGFIVLKPKAWHYVVSNRGKKDYDNLTLNSISSAGKNATLDLNTNDLLVRGVESFTLNDSLGVFVEPAKKEVTIKRNRDIEFDGKVFSGNFRFIGTEFKFDYDNYLIDMTKIDSITFEVEKKAKGDTSASTAKSLKNKLRQSSGKLFINRPDNKSSRQRLPRYPIFDSQSGSYVYFNAPEILGGAYDTTVLFAIPPFSVDSIDNKNGLSAIKFQGEFRSGDIFPPFQEHLEVMPDKSLGFNHQVPPTGYDLYGNKGKYFNKISLDNKGIRGDGEINFQAATLKSADFIFYQDSVLTFPPGYPQAKKKKKKKAAAPTEAIAKAPQDSTGAIAADMPVASADSTGKSTATAKVAKTAKPAAGGKRVIPLNSGVQNSLTIKPGTSGGVSFPKVNLNNYLLKWLPRQDTMLITTTTEEMKLYQDSLTFNGTAAVTPNGLFGNGKAQTALLRMTSPRYQFLEKSFKGNEGLFEIKSSNPEVPAMAAKNAKFAFDLANGKGEFSPEVEGQASIEFPALHYKSSLSGGKVDFKTNIVTMEMPAGSDINKSYFYSTRPDMDSLHFSATGARYDMKAATLNILGVPRIPVFDSYIYPDSGRVYIEENGDVKTLQNAGVLMDTLGRYHKFHSGEIKIVSGKFFTGNALYDYENAGGERYSIKFSGFGLDSARFESDKRQYSRFTSANGTVIETDSFFILPKVQYSGEVAARSNKRELDFKGSVRLAFLKNGIAEWFPFNGQTAADSVSLTLDKLVASDGMPLFTGLHVGWESGTLYSTFVSKKADAKDLDLLLINGDLSYDKSQKLFKMGDKKKNFGESYAGNVMRYNDVTSDISFEGKLNFLHQNRLLNIEASGSGKAKPEKNQYEVVTTMAVDLGLPGAAVDQIGMQLKDRSEGASEAIVTTDQNLPFRLAEFIGNEGVKIYQEKTVSGYVPLPKISPKFVRNLFLSEVPLKWSQENNSWYSTGLIGLSNVNKYEINAQMRGYVEIRKGLNGGDQVTIYLEADPGTWYYLSLTDGALHAVSTDSKFNQIIESKKSTTIVAAEPMEKGQFVNFFRSTYLGAKGGFEDVSEATPVPVQDGEASSAPAKKGKKKKGQDEGTDVQSDIPAADVPDAAPAEGEEKPAKPAKKSKKPKKEEELPPSDVDMEIPAATPEATPDVVPDVTPDAPAKEQEAAPDVTPDVTPETTPATPDVAPETPATTPATQQSAPDAEPAVTPAKQDEPVKEQAPPDVVPDATPEATPPAQEPVKQEQTTPDAPAETTPATPDPIPATPEPTPAAPEPTPVDPPVQQTETPAATPDVAPDATPDVPQDIPSAPEGEEPKKKEKKPKKDKSAEEAPPDVDMSPDGG